MSEAGKGLETIFLGHSVFGGHFRDHTKIQQKWPKFAGLIYFHAEVYLEVNLGVYENPTKKAQICRPDLFPRRSIFGGQFRERTKIQQKGPNLPA